MLAVTLIFGACSGQGVKTENSNIINSKDLPKANVKVNKEYDENGNLIRYDSSYTYYYSSIENDSIAEDSIYDKFRTMFDSEFPFSYHPFFNDIFFQDSLIKYDFYKEDFFTQRFRQNLKQTEKMFQKMDSIKNKFFMEQFPKK
jgi:hypothetical protein